MAYAVRGSDLNRLNFSTMKPRGYWFFDPRSGWQGGLVMAILLWSLTFLWLRTAALRHEIAEAFGHVCASMALQGEGEGVAGRLPDPDAPLPAAAAQLRRLAPDSGPVPPDECPPFHP